MSIALEVERCDEHQAHLRRCRRRPERFGRKRVQRSVGRVDAPQAPISLRVLLQYLAQQKTRAPRPETPSARLLPGIEDKWQHLISPADKRQIHPQHRTRWQKTLTHIWPDDERARRRVVARFNL